MSVVRYVRLPPFHASLSGHGLLLPSILFSFRTAHPFAENDFIHIFLFIFLILLILTLWSVSPTTDTGRTHWGIGDCGGGHLLFLILAWAP